MARGQLDIDRLSPMERVELAEALWDSLRSVPEDIPMTSAQEEELDRRLQAYREDGNPGKPWREVLSKIRQKSG